jgi:hypothetical protein
VVEDVNDMIEDQSDSDTDEDDDDEEYQDVLRSVGSVVSPNEEVSLYSLDRLRVVSSDPDENHLAVYSSQFNGLMMGEMLGAAMSISDKVSSVVLYGTKSWEVDQAAGQVIATFSPELEDSNDLEDVEDFNNK